MPFEQAIGHVSLSAPRCLHETAYLAFADANALLGLLMLLRRPEKDPELDFQSLSQSDAAWTSIHGDDCHQHLLFLRLSRRCCVAERL